MPALSRQPRTVSQGKGISLILGWPKSGGGSKVQSVLFNRDKWDVAAAKKWLRQHGYRSIGLEVTEGKIHARQQAPGRFERMRTQKVGYKVGNPEKYVGVIEDGYVKVYRGKDLIAAGIYAPKVAGGVRGIEFMDQGHVKINKIRQAAMVAMAKAVKQPQGNPGHLAEAEDLSRQFHGRDPEEIIDILEPEKYRKDLTKLGDLRMLELVLPRDMEKGYVTPIQFAEDGDEAVELACTPDGNQILLLAGDQTLDLEALEVPEDLRDKDYIEVGSVHSITYFTDKHHLEGPKYQKTGCEYVHVFGEDGGVKPDLVYDRLNERIILTGGSYKVEDRGIVN